MRLCMPTQGRKGLSETIHNHFGSAPYFTIYDTETKEIDVFANRNEHHEHGTCRPVAAVGDHQIDAVITTGMGKRAVQALNKGGVKVFLLDGVTVEEAILQFSKSACQELTVENACMGHGRHHDD